MYKVGCGATLTGLGIPWLRNTEMQIKVNFLETSGHLVRIVLLHMF